MNVILLLGSSTNKIVDYINETNKISINVVQHADTFEDIEPVLEKILTKADLLIYTDASLGKDPMKNLSNFNKIIEDGYLKVDQIIHLSKTTSDKSQYSDYVLGSRNLLVIKKDKLTLKTIMNAINGKLKEIDSLTSKPADYVQVVRQRKHDRDNLVFKSNPTNKTVIISTEENVKLTEKKEAFNNIKKVKGKKKLNKFSQKVPPSALPPVDDLTVDQPKAIPLINKSLNLETVIITGERKSGKSVFAYALSKGLSEKFKEKVLLISKDFNLMKHKNTTMLKVSDFKNNLNAMIYQVMMDQSPLHVLYNDTDLPNTTVSKVLEIIYANIHTYYKYICIDTNLADYTEIPVITSKATLTCITTPLYESSVVSLVNYLAKLKDNLYTSKYLLVPVNMYNHVQSLNKLSITSTQASISNVLQCNVSTIPELQLKSFEIGTILIDLVEDNLKEAK